jgi:hypothetical protein
MQERVCILCQDGRGWRYRGDTDPPWEVPRVRPHVKRAVRWSGVTLLVLCGLVMTAAVVVYALSTRRLQRVHPITIVLPRTIPADPATVARVKHVAGAMGSCTLCHGQDLGGEMLAEGGPMGTLAAPNLTA